MDSRLAPFGLANSGNNCLLDTTPVALGNGFSKAIRDVAVNTLLLSFDKAQSGHVLRPTTALLNQGVKPCVELLFNDGRTITCTPDHRFLTTDNQWITAGNMQVGQTKIVAGVEYPALQQPVEDDPWNLHLPSLGYSLNTTDRLEEALAFAGLLGYLLTDGCVTGKDSALLIGHALDTTWVQRDIRTVTGIEGVVSPWGKVTHVRFPMSLHAAMRHVGVSVTDRLTSVSGFPTFLLDPNCPAAVVQSFLGGLFGGDGKTPSITWKRGKVARFAELRWSCSRKGSVLESVQQVLTQQMELLFQRVGMRAGAIYFGGSVHQVTDVDDAGRIEVNRRKGAGEKLSNSANEGVDSTKSYSMVWRVHLGDTLAFSEHIGFRYCCHKQMRLTAANAYYRMQMLLKRQKKFLRQHVLDKEQREGSHVGAGTMTAAMIEAKAALAEQQCVHPVTEQYQPCEGKRRGLLRGLQRGYGMSADAALREFDCLKFFSPQRTKQKYDAKQRRAELAADAAKYMSDVNSGIPCSTGSSPSAEDSDVVVETTADKVVYGVPAGACALPTFAVKLVARREVGAKPVFDVSVPGTQNFLAASLVAHNCFINALFQCLVWSPHYSAQLARHLPPEYEPWVTAMHKYKRALQNIGRSYRQDPEASRSFFALATKIIDTQNLRSGFLANTSATSELARNEHGQQDAAEVLLKLFHYIPEKKAISVVRTFFARPTSEVFEDMPVGDRTVLSAHMTGTKCQPDLVIPLQLIGVRDSDRLDVNDLLDKLAYHKLSKHEEYDWKAVDPCGVVRNYRIQAESYEWNNREPPQMCTIHLVRNGPSGLSQKIEASIDMPEFLDLASKFWNPLANNSKMSCIEKSQRSNTRKRKMIVCADQRGNPLEEYDLSSPSSSSSSEDDEMRSLALEEAPVPVNPNLPRLQEDMTQHPPEDEAPYGFIYQQQSFVRHLGRSGMGGHYISYVRTPAGIWFRCDDLKITEVLSSELQEARAKSYVYFYRRVPRPPPASCTALFQPPATATGVDV